MWTRITTGAALAAVPVALAVSAAAQAQSPVTTGHVNHAGEIAEIFNAHCVDCHRSN